VDLIRTNVSKKRIASINRVKRISVTSQKTAFLTFTAVKTSNLSNTLVERFQRNESFTIYIYIERERERERGRVGGRERATNYRSRSKRNRDWECPKMSSYTHCIH
jgi:hypothetical protein